MRIFFLTMILVPSQASSQDLLPGKQDSLALQYEPRHYSNDEAFNITTASMMQHPKIKILMKNSENWAWKSFEKTGLDRSIPRTALTIAAPIVAGKISTRGLHIHWEPVKNLRMRPDLDYYFDSRSYGLAFSLDWRF